MERVTKVVFDTNMLLSIENLKIDVFQRLKEMFGQVDFYVPKQVLEEIAGLKKQLKNRAAARVAEQLMEKNNVKEVVIKAAKADDALVKLAKIGYVVATNDKALKEKLRGQIVYIRQKKTMARG